MNHINPANHIPRNGIHDPPRRVGTNPGLRFIFHADMDSFFASVEQQTNASLRGRPIVVSGKEGSRSVIVASSKEAKKLGIKTGMLPFEAKKIFPKIIFVEPDGDKYAFVSRQVMEIFKMYTEMVEVFSIDEAFLDLTGYVETREAAQALALEIKQNIKNQIGAFVTCSIGVAENKLLAKLASDLGKPDGLFFIDAQNKFAVLNAAKLTDFCGIGRRLEKHLLELGVGTVVELRERSLERLQQAFGHVCGQNLFNIARGVDESPVIPYFEAPEAKSVGRSYTLPGNTFDKEEILAVLMHLCEQVGRELRRIKLAGRTVVVYLRFGDFTGHCFRHTWREGIGDGGLLFRFGEESIRRFRLPKAVRLVGIYAGNLVHETKQQSLWSIDRKKAQLLPYLDEINDKYGDLTVKPAALLKLKRLRKKSGRV